MMVNFPLVNSILDEMLIGGFIVDTGAWGVPSDDGTVA